MCGRSALTSSRKGEKPGESVGLLVAGDQGKMYGGRGG